MIPNTTIDRPPTADPPSADPPRDARYRTSIECPIGLLEIEASDDALTHLYLPVQRRPITAIPPSASASSPDASRLLDETARQLKEYFAGRRRVFDLALAPDGTAFQLAVWSALAEIPYGQTMTYGEVAARVGRPKASRAVGQANGANPIAIILPCHRVLAANTRLGGYSGGLDTKRQLLTLESVTFID